MVVREALTDERVEAAAPVVRGLVAQRLEALWLRVEAGLVEAEEAGSRVDPRLVGQGVAILDRMARVWRLDVRVVERPAVDEAGVREELVGRAVRELEVLEGR